MLLPTLTVIFSLLTLISGQMSLASCSEWSGDRQICVRGNLYLNGTIAAEVTTASHSRLSWWRHSRWN